MIFLFSPGKNKSTPSTKYLSKIMLLCYEYTSLLFIVGESHVMLTFLRVNSLESCIIRLSWTVFVTF